jgi:hypothetical protein
MLAIWLFLPLLMIAFAAVAMVVRSAMSEARRLLYEVHALGDLHPALIAVRDDAARAADAVQRMRSR